MIWYLIGYVLMDLVAGALIGLYSYFIAKRRGYDEEVFSKYVTQFTIKRESKHNNDNTPKFIVVATGIFYTLVWPVEAIRMIFLDIPDAIEYYEAQQNNEELA